MVGKDEENEENNRRTSLVAIAARGLLTDIYFFCSAGVLAVTVRVKLSHTSRYCVTTGAFVVQNDIDPAVLITCLQ